MIVTITKRLEIDVGHRLQNHEGKCKNVHGHRYAFEIECAADHLDECGRIIDFSVIKTVLGGWLDEKWDHGFIYERGDTLGGFLAEHSKAFELDCPPTAENIAQYFLGHARMLMAQHGIDVVAVKLFETPTCWAHVR